MTFRRITFVFLVLLTLGVANAETKIAGFSDESIERQIKSESIIKSIPTPGSFDKHFSYLTDEPHRTGSPRNMELADYVRDRFEEYGLSDVRFHDTPALVSYGRNALVEILEPDRLTLKLAEDKIPEDKHSGLYENGIVVPYHAYSMSGDVSAEVVYANSGSPEDFVQLEEMGIDVRGKIVLMRYSDPYSYRGYKVYLAETHGAAGSIIYSDPEDDGYGKGETHPDGPWGPPSHIQWGAVLYDWMGMGVIPFTFHWTQNDDGDWVEGPVRDRQLPKIPSVPMSHEDAEQILSRLEGPEAPDEWQGGLPIDYHIGPGPVNVRMAIENEETIRTMRNVIGMIPGTDQPEKWVMLGNHRDAWSYGAVDPSGGTAVLLEVARALGNAVKQGYRPKRTIVFANWDGEEDLLGGSTQFAVDYREKLRNDGVVYINLDSGASGPDFRGGATPALADFLRDVAKDIEHPDTGDSLYDAWAAESESGVPEVDTIVGATDYTAFQGNIGMSCIDLAMNGPYGVYHSQYDSYTWVALHGDPGFKRNTMLAQTMAVITWRMANTDILPMKYSNYAGKVLAHLDEVEEQARSYRKIELDDARAAAERWYISAIEFDDAMRFEGLSLHQRETTNDLLMSVERAMTADTGLEIRPYITHLIYAPQPTYREQLLPRVFHAIEESQWDKVEESEAELVAAFDKASELIESANAIGK